MTVLPTLLLALITSFINPWERTRASFLSDNPLRNPVQDVLEYKPATQAVCVEKPTGPIDATLCDYESVESVNEDLFGQLHALVQTPFFKYFKLDLYRECPFWQENGFCMHRECGVTSVDESQVPEKWRAATLSKVKTPADGLINYLPGCYYRDSDFCFLDNEDAGEGEYVDLSVNPEVFTGYDGDSAHRVWRSIYDENCFGLSEQTQLATSSVTPTGVLGGPGLSVGRKSEDENSADGECLEKRVYYKIISGLHASISTHVCYENLDQKTGVWGPDLQCFVNRVAAHPERLQYIYFNTVLLLRAVSRIGPYLSAYDLCSGDADEDDKSRDMLLNVIDIANQVGAFDETALFKGENAKVLKEEFKDHFRNVSRIMDCVGCDKCRLWGKVQVTGVATALKVLFELDEVALDPYKNRNLLQRSEVVALFNTLHRFSESLHVTDVFRDMWKESNADATSSILDKVESRTKSSRPSTPVGSSPSKPPQPSEYPAASMWLEAQSRLLSLLRLCRQNTVECVHQVRARLSFILRKLFSLSGKDEGRVEL